MTLGSAKWALESQVWIVYFALIWPHRRGICGQGVRRACGWCLHAPRFRVQSAVESQLRMREFHVVLRGTLSPHQGGICGQGPKKKWLRAYDGGSVPARSYL